jgi:hypothetical protein
VDANLQVTVHRPVGAEGPVITGQVEMEADTMAQVLLNPRQWDLVQVVEGGPLLFLWDMQEEQEAVAASWFTTSLNAATSTSHQSTQNKIYF